MGLGCGAKTAKLFLFIFNAIFFLCGAALLAVGIWIAVDKSELLKLAAQALGPDNVVNNQLNAGSLVQYGAYVLIAVGVITFLVGFCGCCGACTENKCLLGVYAFLIGLVMIIEIVGAILAGVYHKDVEKNLLKGLQKLQNQSYVGWPRGINDNPISMALDLTMVAGTCCGVNNVSDFTTNYKMFGNKWYKDGRNYSNFNLTIPYSCCKMKDTSFMAEGKYEDITNYLQDPQCGRQEKSHYTNGCFNKMKETIMNYAGVLIGVAAAIIVIELIGIIMACCLIRAIDD